MLLNIYYIFTIEHRWNNTLRKAKSDNNSQNDLRVRCCVQKETKFLLNFYDNFIISSGKMKTWTFTIVWKLLTDMQNYFVVTLRWLYAHNVRHVSLVLCIHVRSHLQFRLKSWITFGSVTWHTMTYWLPIRVVVCQQLDIASRKTFVFHLRNYIQSTNFPR